MTSIRLIAVFAIPGVLAMCSCTQESRPAPPPDGPTPFPDLGIVCSNYPLVDGSTSTQPLGVFTACRVLDAGYEWALWNTEDIHRLYASEWFLFADPDYDGEKRELCDWINKAVRHRGTHAAYVNLIKKRAELVLVARQPSADELSLAARKEVRLDVQAIAHDAFVLLLNTDNPVTELTVDQIRKIYTSEIVNWSEVGGPDVEIHPFQRNRNSGSQELMEQMVMDGRRMMRVPEMMAGTSMAEPFTMLDNDVYGIGYSVYFYQEHMAPHATVKACAINGVPPDRLTIKDGTYPFVTEVYAVILQGSPPDSAARRLRDWLLTPTGQAIIGQCGYVPIGETDPRIEADPQFMKFR